ncbi:hypothetical protein [Vacuolonema iberomarrocanum]|uniref:hypothetical protein n=1 Tax=Vacuolonema iberomarrocanum TaxID=3454632 RepID=UPI0019DBCE0C|nr:hypothetical protein [filamentous cyanobacterium LEGE 07170]
MRQLRTSVTLLAFLEGVPMTYHHSSISQGNLPRSPRNTLPTTATPNGHAE